MKIKRVKEQRDFRHETRADVKMTRYKQGSNTVAGRNPPNGFDEDAYEESKIARKNISNS